MFFSAKGNEQKGNKVGLCKIKKEEQHGLNRLGFPSFGFYKLLFHGRYIGFDSNSYQNSRKVCVCVCVNIGKTILDFTWKGIEKLQ